MPISRIMFELVYEKRMPVASFLAFIKIPFKGDFMLLYIHLTLIYKPLKTRIMKKIYFITALLLLTVMSCGKEEVNEEEQDLDAIALTSADLPQNLKGAVGDSVVQFPETINPANILRIEEKVPVKWSGVKGCSKQSTINSNVKKAFEAWVGKKVLQHPNLRVINYGYPPSKVKTSSSKSPWPDNKRKCRGWYNP